MSDTLDQLIEQACEQVMFLDAGDLPGLAKFCQHLQAVAAAFEKAGDDPANNLACEAAKKAASLIEDIILEQSKDAAVDIGIASRCVSSLQAVARGRGLKEAAFPAELELSTSTEAPATKKPARGKKKAAEATTPAAADMGSLVELRAGVDEDLFNAYLEQQQSVLPDMEAAILTFEENRQPEPLAALRRILHTMKGESGVVGMNDIGTFCHSAEECLDGSGGDISVDLLLEIKDWLEKAIKAYATREKPSAPPDILAMRKQAAVGKTLNVESGTLSVETRRAEKSEGSAAAKDCRPTEVPPTPAAKSGSVQMPSSVPISDRDLAKDFVGESQEHFDAADENLLILEDDPANTDAVGAVFRAFHTIKGVSGFLGLKPVGDLAHVAETLLDEVRKGKRQFTGNVVDVTFAGLDMLKTMMGDLKDALSAGTDMQVRPELAGLIGSLKAVLAGVEQPLSVESGTLKVERETVKTGAGGAGANVENEHRTSNIQHPTSNEEKAQAGTIDASEHRTSNIQRPTPNVEKAQASEIVGNEHPAPNIQRPASNEEKAGATDGSAAAGNATEKTTAPREGVEVGQTMKVDAEKIDLLLDTIGELVIAESIVASDPDIQKLKSLRLEKNLSLLGKITRSLQDMGMAMRLVPIDATFRKMARLVRDLSKKSGKHVELAIEGGETEIDKSMVEKLGDPLVHMIRNSMDHGVESNEERKAKGKDPVGHVTLRAHHKGGSIHIDIEDDGKGLDREAIVAKAIEKGILKTGDGVPDQEVFALIFAAGFSTAKQITEISGRGVGMDVVRRNIESLRGNVLINTRPGQGTTFTIVLPLTMAIIDGMLARVSSEIYVLPTLSIIESLRPSPDMISSVTGKGEMVAFRGNLLPLFRLSDIFHVSGALTNPSDAIVMVVEEGGKRWGLLVDEILGQQQIVIKSLGDAMGVVPGVSGASIMADGRPGLILDIAGVIKLATE